MTTPQFSSPEAPPAGIEMQTDDIDAIAKKSKILSALVVKSQAELNAMPREALIRAAWQGLASYHHELFVRGGESSPDNIAFRKEVDFRLSLLTPEERKQAVKAANDYLDDECEQ